MRGERSLGAGSLDMLLDTMCNTFGGVCFIALMVAILTAMNPKGDGTEAEGDAEARMLVDKEVAKLTRQRDELKSAIAIQESFLATNKDSKVVENWVDALFLQEIDFKYDEGNINERFLVKFPENTKAQTTRQEELQATAQESVIEENSNVIPITVAGQTNKTSIYYPFI